MVKKDLTETASKKLRGRALHASDVNIWVRFAKNDATDSYRFCFGGFHICSVRFPSINARPAHRRLLRAFAPLGEPHSRPSTILGDKLDTCALKSRNQL